MSVRSHSCVLPAAAAVACLATGANAADAQTAPTGSPSAAAPAAGALVLRGTVFDSLARGPLVEATVQAVRPDDPAAVRTARTDSLGRFQFEGLAPARYVVGFLHPVLTLLGIDVRPVLVDLSAGASGAVDLAVPRPSAVRAAVCPAVAADDSSGAIAGDVRDAATGAPSPDATVVITWSETEVSRAGAHTERRRVAASVRADGGFLVCGVPADGAVEVSAQAPGRATGLLEVAVPPRGVAVQRLALGPVPAPVAVVPPASGGAGGSDVRAAIPDTTGAGLPAAGPGRLTGVVIGLGGQPARGTRVRVWGTAAQDTTDDAGRFTLAGLPIGTFTVEARAIGLEPVRRAVDLWADQVTTVRLEMTRPAVTLERVVVKASAVAQRLEANGFEARRRGGTGRYYTTDSIRAMRVADVSDIVRTTPTLRVTPAGARGNVIRGRGGCVPPVFVDGIIVQNGANEIDVMLNPGLVAAVEVYGSGALIPAQFNPTGTGGSARGAVSCGAVVIWTQR